MGIRFGAVLLSLLLLPAMAIAGDFGPRRDVSQVRSDARRLLAHRVRLSGMDPAAVTISDVVVAGDQALLSWDSGKTQGIMGLVRYVNRWWDALDTSTGVGCVTETYPLNEGNTLTKALLDDAVANNPRVRSLGKMVPCRDGGLNDPPLRTAGATLHAQPMETSGYDLWFGYARNDAAPGVRFTQIYGRAPTAGEMLPNPPPPRGWGGSTDIFLFDLAVGGSKPIAFQSGSTVDVWFPFVLDDSLRYRISYFAMGKVSPTIQGTVYDNVLHFQLPAFTMAPGDTLMADLEGWY